MMAPSAPTPGKAPVQNRAKQIRYWLVEERRRLLASVAGLSEDEAQQSLEPDGWAVHAILAHRLFWEGREVEAVGQYLLGCSVELLDFPVRRLDGANAAAVSAMQHHRTDRILRELRETRTLLGFLVQRVPDTDLNTRGNPVRVLLGVALEHDREHSRQIQCWREHCAIQTLRQRDDPSKPESENSPK